MSTKTAVQPAGILAVRDALKQIPPGRVVVVGMGSPYRSDDRAGLHVADLVQRVLRQEAKGAVGPTGMHLVGSIVAQSSPEKTAATIALLNPDTVVLVSTAPVGADAGNIALLCATELAQRPDPEENYAPVLALMQSTAAQTGARVLLLGIQAARTQWGSVLTPAVRHAARLVACMLLHTSGVLPRVG